MAPCGRRAPPICDCECLFRVAGIQRIPGLLLQPPLEVLPSPAGMVVETALRDLDVLIRFTDHNYHMAIAAVIVAEQIPGADLIPAWVVHPPPWEIAKRGVRTQRGPAGAVGPPVVGPTAGGAIRRGVHCPGGVSFPELRQSGLYTFFCRGRRCGGKFFSVRLGAVDVDAVGGGTIGHTEVYRSADVPELDEIVPMDVVRFKPHLLPVHVEGLGGGCGGELLGGGAGGAAQGKASKDADPDKNCFPFSVHDDSPFGLLYLWQTQPCRRIARKSRTIRTAAWRKAAGQTKHIAQGMRLPCVSGCSLTDYSIVNFSGSIFNGTFFKIPSCSKTLFEVYCS